MKKILFILVAFVAIFSLSACKQAEEVKDKVMDEEGPYKDGVYNKVGEKWEYGYETVDVTIEGGKITEVVLHRLDLDGNEVDYEEWVGQEIAPGRVKPNLKQYRIDIANEIINEQSAEYADAVSGATITTENWIFLVQDILNENMRD